MLQDIQTLAVRLISHSFLEFYLKQVALFGLQPLEWHLNIYLQKLVGYKQLQFIVLQEWASPSDDINIRQFSDGMYLCFLQNQNCQTIKICIKTCLQHMWGPVSCRDSYGFSTASNCWAGPKVCQNCIACKSSPHNCHKSGTRQGLMCHHHMLHGRSPLKPICIFMDVVFHLGLCASEKLFLDRLLAIRTGQPQYLSVHLICLTRLHPVICCSIFLEKEKCLPSSMSYTQRLAISKHSETQTMIQKNGYLANWGKCWRAWHHYGWPQQVLQVWSAFQKSACQASLGLPSSRVGPPWQQHLGRLALSCLRYREKAACLHLHKIHIRSASKWSWWVCQVHICNSFRSDTSGSYPWHWFSSSNALIWRAPNPLAL